MVRTASKYRLQRVDHIDGFGLRLAGFRPVVPRHRVHPRFGEHRPSVIILGIPLNELPHRVRIGDILGTPLRFPIAGIPRRQRLNKAAFDFRGTFLKLDGFRDRFVGSRRSAL